MTIAEALSAMAAIPLRRARIIRINVRDAVGRTLAVPISAVEDVPPFSRSRVDGYAVIADDVAGASTEKPATVRVVGEIAMGAAPPGPIARGQAMRISTGGALPPGADAAIMIEDTEESDGIATVRDASDAEANVTLNGADVRRGDLLFDSATILTPARVGMLAGAGIDAVDVFERPRVGMLLTGDELVAPGDPIHPGEIRDINRFSLAGALAAMGFEPVQFERVPDDRAAFEAAFARAVESCDAVVISGGSSAGARDFTPDVVQAAGPPGVIVHHVRAKPGRPTVLGAVGDKPVIGLPGNPVSALVMLETLGKPILLRMLDRRPNDVAIRAVLSQTIDVSPTLEHRIPVALHREDGIVSARPLFGTSAMMHILAFADALVTVPLGVGRIDGGTSIDAWPLSAPPRA
ncbi:MAG TPA: gephyrin-like molybdotransferase Glp [Candidatus Eremiobacteraceae bacterium]|nr:gephyrin-like molybdotransferase Glp [Candidatus Eremiobacteraceae bacterium]